MENFETLEVDTLLNNLPVYKQLIDYLNTLDPSITIKTGMAYLRVSTDDQTEYSPEAQLEDIIKYCITNKIMLPKENIFVENGISGRTADKRVAFQRMISKASEKPKPCDVILVHKFDRFARNREESVVYKSKLRKKLGIDVVAVKEPLPEDKKMALIMESQLETMGEYYSLNLADEVLKGLRKKADRGEHIGRPPFGYIKVIKEIIKERIGGKIKEKIIRELVVDRNEAKVVRLIFDRFCNHVAILDIVREINSLGIKTKNGKEFDDRAIKWILNNPIYIGYVRWTEGGMGRNWDNENITKRQSTHEPIISIDVWNKAQEILKENKEIFSKRSKPQVKHEHWLRGLIKCDNCGHQLVKNNTMFQCCGYTKGLCSISHSISVKKVENAIITQLKHDFENKPINIEISNKRIDYSSDISIIKSQIQQIEIKEKRIKLAYENGVDSLEEYKENKERLQNDKILLSKELEKLINNNEKDKVHEEIYQHCGDVYKILTDTSVSEEDKYVAIHHLIDKIIYVKSSQTLVIYYK